MKASHQHIKEFLADLDMEELNEIAKYIDELLGGLKNRGPGDRGKRPHMAMRERRGGGERYPVDLPARCWHALAPTAGPAEREEPEGGKGPWSDASTRKHPVRVLDLSREGCSILAHTAFAVGQLLVLQLRAPDGASRRVFRGHV